MLRMTIIFPCKPYQSFTIKRIIIFLFIFLHILFSVGQHGKEYGKTYEYAYAWNNTENQEEILDFYAQNNRRSKNGMRKYVICIVIIKILGHTILNGYLIWKNQWIINNSFSESLSNIGFE